MHKVVFGSTLIAMSLAAGLASALGPHTPAARPTLTVAFPKAFNRV